VAIKQIYLRDGCLLLGRYGKVQVLYYGLIKTRLLTQGFQQRFSVFVD